MNNAAKFRVIGGVLLLGSAFFWMYRSYPIYQALSQPVVQVELSDNSFQWIGLLSGAILMLLLELLYRITEFEFSLPIHAGIIALCVMASYPLLKPVRVATENLLQEKGYVYCQSKDRDVRTRKTHVHWYAWTPPANCPTAVD